MRVFNNTLKILDKIPEWQLRPEIPNSVIHGQCSTGFVELMDGTRLYFEDSLCGEDEEKVEEVLFFIYGLGCSIGHWKYQMAYFLQQQKAGKKLRIVWSDFRGHGKSTIDAENSPFSVEQLAEDVALVCEHLNISSAVFLGQSMGGTVALKLAEAHPSLVKKLVLQGSPPVSPSRSLDAGPIGPEVWKFLIKLNRVSPAAIRLIYKGLPNFSRPISQLIRFIGFNASLVRDDDVKEYTQALLAGNPNIFWQLASDMEDFDIAKFSTPVSASTLILAGNKDRCVPMDQIEYLAEHLENVVIQVIPHGSHCPHLDDPDLVNHLIADFLEK